MVPVKKMKLLRSSWKKTVFKMSQLQKSFTPSFFTLSSNQELQEIGKRYYQQMLNFWAPTFPPELGNYGSEAVLASSLQKHVPPAAIPQVMEILTAPEEISFYQQEEQELAACKTNHEILKHQQKYFWLKNGYGGTQVLPLEFFQQRKKSHYPINLKKHLQEVQQKKKEAQRKYTLPSEVMNISQAITFGIGWQDERKKNIFIMLHYKQAFIEAISCRTDTPTKTLLQYSFTENLDHLAGKKLPLRETDFGFYAETNFFKELSAKQSWHYWQKYVAAESKDISTITGIIASTGKKVCGKVQVLLDPGQEFTGEILVAPMTSPDYIFAMKKAKAIVTDTGGLTSHAAIVSRELGVPCLVGTKIATKVLKDGDLVEVDAEKGIIKKLKKE